MKSWLDLPFPLVAAGWFLWTVVVRIWSWRFRGFWGLALLFIGANAADYGTTMLGIHHAAVCDAATNSCWSIVEQNLDKLFSNDPWTIFFKLAIYPMGTVLACSILVGLTEMIARSLDHDDGIGKGCSEHQIRMAGSIFRVLGIVAAYGTLISATKTMLYWALNNWQLYLSIMGGH